MGDPALVEEVARAHADEWERWGTRDHRWGGKGFEVYRYDDSDIAGEFSEIHSGFETQKSATAFMEATRATRSAQAALSVVRKALETPTEEMITASILARDAGAEQWAAMLSASPLYRRG